jgi:hypothetical protein
MRSGFIWGPTGGSRGLDEQPGGVSLMTADITTTYSGVKVGVFLIVMLSQLVEILSSFGMYMKSRRIS